MRTLHLIVLLTTTLFVQAQGWQWSKHIGGPGFDGAQIGGVDNEGSVYIHGYYGMPTPFGQSPGCYFENDTLEGTENSFIVKYSSNGDLVWLKGCLATSGSVGFGAFAIDTLNGFFYAVGSLVGVVSMDTVTITSSQYIGFISKWTLDGACLWVKPVSTSPISTTVFALTIDPQGQLMLAGVTAEYLTTQVGNEVLAPGSFLARCDTDGNMLWAKQLMAYGMQQRNYTIYSLRNIGQDVVGYGQAYMYSEEDTIRVDDEYFTGGTGSAIGLVRLSTSTGQAQWLRVEGYPGNGVGLSLSQRMVVDQAERIVVAGSWNDMAIFGGDTLLSNNTQTNGCIVRYDGQGSKDLLLDYRAVEPGYVGFSALDINEDGALIMSGSVAGEFASGTCWATSTIGWSSVVIRMDSTGTCQDMLIGWTGHANSVAIAGQSIYMTGWFPDYGPTGTSTIGNNTYTTHGWKDILLAKHDLPTSIAPKSAGDDRLLIYANPNQGSFRLLLPEALRYAPKLVLRVYDATGRHLHEQLLERHEERPKVDVRNVSPGFYMVTVSDGKRTYSGNMVVE